MENGYGSERNGSGLTDEMEEEVEEKREEDIRSDGGEEE